MSILTRDRIYFLLKDPYWSFICWQVNWTESEKQISNPGAHVIRIHDVTDIIFDGRNSHGYVELENIDGTDHWYFQIPRPARNYCAEIGIRTGPGFSVIARSNTLFVPRAGPSASHEERWSAFNMP
jgi:hypothetical protein